MTDLSGQVFLNGDYLPLDRARISVLDRGFLFGDGVYEVIPCYNRQLFRLAKHLQRLDNSLHAIRMQNPLSSEAWRQILEKLVAQCPDSEQWVYLQVTRGAYSDRNHAIPDRVEPTLFAMTNPLPPADPKLARDGISAHTVDDIRWQLCDIKATTLLGNVLLRDQSASRGGAEAILIREGFAVEGAASNLFAVQNGIICTPPKSRFLLPGITRDLVLELAADAGLETREQSISEAALRQAQELWVTSSTKEILPVTRLDDVPVGSGTPGPLYRRMTDLYGRYKASTSGRLVNTADRRKLT